MTTDHFAEEAPVFVTRDGRARPHVRWLARLVTVALASWLAAVLAGGTGFATLPPLPANIAARAAGIAAAPQTTFVKLQHRPRVHAGRI